MLTQDLPNIATDCLMSMVLLMKSLQIQNLCTNARSMILAVPHFRWSWTEFLPQAPSSSGIRLRPTPFKGPLSQPKTKDQQGALARTTMPEPVMRPSLQPIVTGNRIQDPASRPHVNQDLSPSVWSTLSASSSTLLTSYLAMKGPMAGLCASTEGLLSVLTFEHCRSKTSRHCSRTVQGSI